MRFALTAIYRRLWFPFLSRPVDTDGYSCVTKIGDEILSYSNYIFFHSGFSVARAQHVSDMFMLNLFQHHNCIWNIPAKVFSWMALSSLGYMCWFNDITVSDISIAPKSVKTCTTTKTVLLYSYQLKWPP